jgi:hypothetical protein
MPVETSSAPASAAAVQLINKRPLSPDVFELGSVTQPHYKMPWGALSSIANRATGAALSAGEQQQLTVACSNAALCSTYAAPAVGSSDAALRSTCALVLDVCPDVTAR